MVETTQTILRGKVLEAFLAGIDRVVNRLLTMDAVTLPTFEAMVMEELGELSKVY